MSRIANHTDARFRGVRVFVSTLAIGLASAVSHGVAAAHGADTLSAAPAATVSPIPEWSRLAPAREQVTALALAIGTHPIRVNGRFGVVEISKPWIDSTGVGSLESSRRPSRKALIVLKGAPSEPAPPDLLPWEAIDRIELGESQWRAGAAWGAAAWLVANIAVAPWAAWLLLTDESERSGATALVVGSLVASMGIGAALGSSSRKYRTLYLAPGYVPPLDTRDVVRKRRPDRSRVTPEGP